MSASILIRPALNVNRVNVQWGSRVRRLALGVCIVRLIPQSLQLQAQVTLASLA
jgi:hypothetical protein